MNSTSAAPVIFWFRQDLRLEDNPALSAATQRGTIVPIYILDESIEPKLGSASKWWLYHSLQSLSKSLNANLNFYHGDSGTILKDLCGRTGAISIYSSICYEPAHTQNDQKIVAELGQTNISFQTFPGSLLWDPAHVLKSDGTPYKVFTPFYKNGCLGFGEPELPVQTSIIINTLKDTYSLDIDALELISKNGWHRKFENHWQIGEVPAREKMQQFALNLGGYKTNRNVPALPATSRLSPHLHFGEISPRQVWHSALKQRQSTPLEDLYHFLSELAWREFSYYLLHHFPRLPWENFQKKFDNFPQLENPQLFEAWKKGQTGYPIVDAGMRELWETGYMHNRTRMIVGSFLTKNLLIDWRAGAEWFWDCLVDADLANNSASWQWIAGSGADAAPYFRVFNPVLQSEKFDPDGIYIKKYIPELEHLTGSSLHKPWEAPPLVLATSGVQLGTNYPKPIVDLDLSRKRALGMYEQYIKTRPEA